MRQFLQEHALWEWLGLSAEAAERRDPHLLARYLRIIDLIQTHREAEAEMERRKAAHVPGPRM